VQFLVRQIYSNRYMSWQEFRKQNKGKGLSMQQLGEMYRKRNQVPAAEEEEEIELVVPPRRAPTARLVSQQRFNTVAEELRKCREHGKALEEQIRTLKNPTVVADRLKRINAMMEREINAMRTGKGVRRRQRGGLGIFDNPIWNSLMNVQNEMGDALGEVNKLKSQLGIKQ